MLTARPLQQARVMARILIVDDDEDVAWAVEMLLRHFGHVVRIACDGETGLRMLQESTPDLVVLDVEMPVMDGPAMAYRMFVHNCGLENIPIVLLSGVNEFEAVARRVGTPYFLPKPFEVADLLQLVDRALNERILPRPAT